MSEIGSLGVNSKGAMSAATPRLTNVAIAIAAVVLFQLVTMASGTLAVRNGLGWDGAAYARMMTGKLSDGSPNTAVRPLVILAARVPYHLGAGVIESFRIIDYLSAFLLYLFVALLLDARGSPASVRAVLTINLALCIATSKLFGFYPVLIDLGAMAVTTAAFYFIATDRRWSGAVACVFAASAREFGLAVALYGIHRGIRTGERPFVAVARYLPALLLTVVIRLPIFGLVHAGDPPLTAADALGNLRNWTHWPFVLAFVYFAVTVFGGISALLVVRARRCVAQLWREPELITFAAVIVAAAAAGSLDIWRYLAFVLPAAVVLSAACVPTGDAVRQRQVLIAVTLVTLLTQRPFQAMTTETYFRDWFPLYDVSNYGLSLELVRLWALRLASLVLACVALWSISRRARSRPETAAA